MKRIYIITILIAVLLPSQSFANRYLDNHDGTLTDTITGLIWQINADELKKTWWDALDYCNNFTVYGRPWRLPNVKELQSIAYYNGRPTLDYIFKNPNSVLMNYWTSTTVATVWNRAWQIHFVSGRVADGHTKDGTAYVRCVR